MLLAVIIFAAPFVQAESKTTASKINVYVVNYPLQYFTERIGGEHVNAIFPVPSGVDPAFWVPDISSISAYQQADLIFLNGADYAKWVQKVSLPHSKVVNSSARFKNQYIRIQGAITHSHGPGGEHAHQGVAFTTWLDFDLASKQAKAIADALSKKQSEFKDIFQKNYKALEKELMGLDQEIKIIISKDPSKPIIGSHPVNDYLARRYGLNMKSVNWEPDEVPSDTQWSELQALLKKHPAKLMIWEGEPIEESVERLKAIGINSMVFDTCGNTPEQGDFMSVMQQNVENLKMEW